MTENVDANDHVSIGLIHVILCTKWQHTLSWFHFQWYGHEFKVNFTLRSRIHVLANML